VSNLYLNIAENVLLKASRPLTPREILDFAFIDGLVPSHLHGHTQHKTLQARLSEDISHYLDQSRFFRTAPGRFFLRAYPGRAACSQTIIPQANWSMAS
jgi:hypothetical protein